MSKSSVENNGNEHDEEDMGRESSPDITSEMSG